jgi:CRP/FNR family transcriptional regulator, cyclic AMP receptor protein
MAVQQVRTSQEVSPSAIASELACFGARGWLSSVNPALRDRILAAGRAMSFTRGKRLFSAGAPPGGIYGVFSGGIAAEGSTAWHPPRVGHVFRAGHWFGHGPALAGGARAMGYLAIEDSRVLHIPLPALRVLMDRDAEITRLVGAMANLGSQLATSTACDLLIPDAPRRVAAVLLRITGAHEGVEPTEPEGFRLTQTEIGEMANVSRNHVNRVLAQFASDGWIVKSYSQLRLRDIAALSGFAYGEPV